MPSLEEEEDGKENNEEARREGATAMDEDPSTSPTTSAPAENVQIQARLMEMLKRNVKIGQASGVPGKDVPVDLIAKAFIKLGKSIGCEENEDVILDHRKNLEREIKKYEQDVLRKLKHSERVAEREGVTYEKEALRLKKKFEETEEEVKKLKVEVKSLREDGKSEERREKLRAEISKLPEKKVSEAALKNLENEIARLEKESEEEERETKEALEALEIALSSITKLPGEDVVVEQKEAAAAAQKPPDDSTTQSNSNQGRKIEQKPDAEMPMIIQDAAEDGEIV